MRRPQNSLDYRSARRAFIAACQQAGYDSIARVHPWALGPDGKPLFIDSVALGPRDATRALLVVTGLDGRDGGLGSLVLQSVLNAGAGDLAGRRMVLVHALNPFGFAWAKCQNEEGLALDEPEARGSWSFAMLDAILTEDIRGGRLVLLEVGRTAKAGDSTQAMLAEVAKNHDRRLALAVARLALTSRSAVPLAARGVATALARL